MDITEILQKLVLGLKYKMNCELGFQDCGTLLKHIEDLKNAISEQNRALTTLKQAAVKVVEVSKPSKKGKKV